MAETNTKSGLGTTSGVVSELSAFLTVKNDHEEELRAALQRFNERVSWAPRQVHQKVGIRNFRHVIYDGGGGSCGQPRSIPTGTPTSTTRSS